MQALVTHVAILLLLPAGLLTIWFEYRRRRALTPILLLTIGNLAYFAVNPYLFLVSPSDAEYFAYLVSLMNELTFEGVASLLLAAFAFQLGLLGVSLTTRRQSMVSLQGSRNGEGLISAKALTYLGIADVVVGLIGMVWMGIIYNGTPFGLYRLSYAEHGTFFHGASVPAFLLDVGKYGASLLMAVAVLDRRPVRVAVVFLAMTLHGVALKSKLPIFHIACVYAVAQSLSGAPNKMRALIPLGLAGLVIGALGILRGAEDIFAIPRFFDDNREVVMRSVSSPWENDFPGPAAAAYIVVNDPYQEWSMGPLWDVVTYFVPKFVVDRGLSVSELYSKRLLGSGWQPGLGPGWSLISDGYLMLGQTGVVLVGAFVGWLGRRVDQLRASNDDLRAECGRVFVCVSSPLFLFAPRAALASLLKVLLVVWVVSILPVLAADLLQRSRGVTTSRPARV